MKANALIIFTKNPVYGKVKTRLAATIGNSRALEIYKRLIAHTYTVTQNINADKLVYYNDAVEEKDLWQKGCIKQVQDGKDLGKRMMNAFEFAFKNDYKKVLIIGTDCPQLSEKIISAAFIKLEKYDVVLGPAFDGGYYLLGMKKMHENLFNTIEWSTAHVLSTTIQRCKQNDLTYFLSEELHDVDEEKDLVYVNNVDE